jgi:hypothetical protein
MFISAYLPKRLIIYSSFKRKLPSVNIPYKKLFHLFFLASTAHHITNQGSNKLGC